MYTNITIKTLIGIGITQFKFDEGIEDETTYLEKCQEQVGVTTTNDAIFGTPTKNWTTFKVKYDEIMSTFPMGELRIERNRRLAETDFYALSDVTLADNMKTYRQNLRDLPDGKDTVDKCDNVTWPTKP